MLLLHQLNDFGYNSSSIVMLVGMFLLLPIFCCNFFLIYHFVTAKAALPKKSEVFAA